MTQPQGLYGPTSTSDLRVDEAQYFGAPLRDIQHRNREMFGLVETPSTDLYRISYVYQKVIQVADEYGGIQVRGRTFLHLVDGGVPVRMQRHVQRAAHRAAYIFDSATEIPSYDHYLTGFGGEEGTAMWENQPREGEGEPTDLNYQNWEVERVTGVDSGAAGVGAIDWSLEIYQEEEDGTGFTGFALLSGLATGTANPWDLVEHEDPGESPIHIPPTKWVIGWEPSRRRGEGEYYVRPQPDTDASLRYGQGAGRGKAVYINGKPISDGTDSKARAWLSPEYGIGDGLTYRGKYSREGLVEDTGATYQAIRKGGVLYQTGETRDAIHLKTAKEKPEGWKAGDPDNVPIDLEAREGSPPTVTRLLSLPDPEDSVPVTVATDERILKHLGKSSPPYTHHVARMWEWPGFRPVEAYANTGEYHPEPRTVEAGPETTQDDLDDYGGDV